MQLSTCISSYTMWCVYLICLAVFANSEDIVNYTTTLSSNTQERVTTTESFKTTLDVSHKNASRFESGATDVSTDGFSTTPPLPTSRTASTAENGTVKNDSILNRPKWSVKNIHERNLTKLEKKKRMEQHRLDKLAREKERDAARAKLAKQRAEREREYTAKVKSKKIKYNGKHTKAKKTFDKNRKYPTAYNRNRPVKKVCVQCEEKILRKQKENNRKASLRRQILEKLRIDPTLSIPKPVVPPEILRRSMMDDESDNDDDGYAKTTDIMVFGQDITRKCRFRKSSGCFKFNLRNKIAGHVTSAELFVYKLHDPNDGQQSIFLSELKRPKFRKLTPKNIITRMDTDIAEGWLQFRLDKTVQRWVEKPHTNDGLAVKCKTCARKSHKQLYSAKEGYKPVLIVHVQPLSKRRYRRSNGDCGAMVSGCCKHNFWVDFSEINLYRVLRPLGVWANYCTGSCGVTAAGHYNHTSLLQDIRLRSDTANATIRQAITPCCGAVRLKTMSLLYVDDEGDIRHAHVPNLAVDECGCL